MAAAQEHEQEIARLQGRLGDLLTQLRTFAPASPGYGSAADDAFAAAEQLLAYEDRVPELLDEQPRQISTIVLRGCGAVTMLLAAALAIGVVPGGREWWWLPIAVLLAVAGARLLTTRVRRPQAQHIYQRQPAVMIAAGAMLAGVASLGLARGWLLAAAALLVASGVVLGLRTPQLRDRTPQLRDRSRWQPGQEPGGQELGGREPGGHDPGAG